MTAKLPTDTTHRVCSCCKANKLLTEFPRKPSGSLGRAYKCTECRREYDRAHKHMRKTGAKHKDKRFADETIIPVPHMSDEEAAECARFRKLWTYPVDRRGPLVPVVIPWQEAA